MRDDTLDDNDLRRTVSNPCSPKVPLKAGAGPRVTSREEPKEDEVGSRLLRRLHDEKTWTGKSVQTVSYSS